MTQEEKKRRGRPPKAPSERKRGNVTIRVRDRLYERLTEEAAKSQRSLSEEIERGLEAYYEQREAYGELARFVGTAVRAIETANGKPWFADDDMRLKARATVEAVLDLLVGPRTDESARASDEIISWMHFKLRGQESLALGQLPPKEPDIEFASAQISRGIKFLEAHIESVKSLQAQLQNMPPQSLARLGINADLNVPAEGVSKQTKGQK